MRTRTTRGRPRRTTAARALAPPAVRAYPCEASVAVGLESIARAELQRLLGNRVTLRREEPGALGFEYRGEPRALLDLRTVLAVYLVCRFDVPRPRALLGDQHLRTLLGGIALARALAPPGAYHTLYLSAAGSDSAILLRLKEVLAAGAGLSVAPREGDLQLRLRRASDGNGWEMLIRLSPRPLATRPWRVCNMEGALNATVAHAMALLTRPTRGDVYLNLACGSGTLLVERLACGRLRRAIGCDTSAAALACAEANLSASGDRAAVELQPWDAQELPLPAGSVDALCADLPFGHLVGSHQENTTLYPGILREAARVAQPGARFALITHQARLMETLLRSMDAWSVEQTMRVSLGDLQPRIFVLCRQ